MPPPPALPVHTQSFFHGGLRRSIPAALLACAALVGCRAAPPVGAPTVAPAKVEEDRRAEFAEAFRVYGGGDIDRALQRFRAMPDHPAAVAAIALLENRPEAVLALPTTDDPALLRAQAWSAMLIGDVDAAERLQRWETVLPDSRIKLGPWLAAARLARARPLLRVTGETPAQVPFDTPQGLPVITVRVGDHTERFFFDTGADMTVIDARAADRLGVRRAAGTEGKGEGAAGSFDQSLGLVDRLEVLGLTLEDVPVTVSDIGSIATLFDAVGILGVTQLLRHDVVAVDYGARHIARSRQSRAEGWPMMFLSGSAISLRGKLEGGSEGLFHIDTGVDAPVISHAYLNVARALHAHWSLGPIDSRVLRAMGRDQTISIQAIDGARFCPSGEASPSCLDIGTVSLREGVVEACSRVVGIDHVGVLGGTAFQNRVLELDYPALRVRVRPGGKG